ncbi:FkbM family methyltransferase [Solimonas sp. K1W22B-7]|uniref:FkbM family methyltransferase n=1 Tax=Solimonas sp. K1W22B-7 TaxID=2303331 RepID=UPI0013C49493|nr:FkbM family methyltransferase [Solimonas sp. K1W22B-7]
MSKAMPQFDTERAWGHFAPRGWRRWLIGLCRRLDPDRPWLYRVSLWLRSPVKHRSSLPMDVVTWGLRMRLLPRGNTSEIRLLFTPRWFDREELKWLALRLDAGATFVDIGANAGAYSFFVRSRFGAGVRILAVEPDPEMRRRIAYNMASNGIANIEVCPVALSDRRGEALLELHEGQRGQNTLVEASAAGRSMLAVPVDTLANLLAERGVTRVDALKIDIEGHEPRVLGHFFRHAAPTLWPRALLTEFKADTGPEILRILQAAGYRRTRITRLNWLFERTADGAGGSLAPAFGDPLHRQDELA